MFELCYTTIMRPVTDRRIRMMDVFGEIILSKMWANSEKCNLRAMIRCFVIRSPLNKN
jgi:hypothetical protein